MSSVYIERVVSVIDSSPNSQAQKPPPDVCVEVCSTGSVLAGTASAYWRIAVGGIPKLSKLRAAPVRPSATSAENAAGCYQDLLWAACHRAPPRRSRQPARPLQRSSPHGVQT